MLQTNLETLKHLLQKIKNSPAGAAKEADMKTRKKLIQENKDYIAERRLLEKGLEEQGVKV